MEPSELQVVIADDSHLNALRELVRAIKAEDHPDAPKASERASEGMQRSLRHFDALKSDCVWFLIAFFGDQPAGMAILSRIPKLDQRL